jgi:DNA-binding transcriptional regulator YiaG
MKQPVKVAKTLTRFGLTLRKAHLALNRLASLQVVALRLDVENEQDMIADLNDLGVVVVKIAPPMPDVKKIREGFGLSQSEFALRFCLEVDTVRNWEQGRNQPDPAARLLLKVIEIHPEAVESALLGPQADLWRAQNNGALGAVAR